MRTSNNIRRIAFAMLAAGFAYSGAASLRLYADIFRTPAAHGPDATVDQFLQHAHLGSAAEIRRAVEQAGWPRDVDIVLATANSEDTTAAQYALSYVLYPRRVWLPTAAPLGTTHVAVISSGGVQFITRAQH